MMEQNVPQQELQELENLEEFQEEEKLEECRLCSEEIFDGKILHVFKDTVRLPDGAEGTREYLRHVGAVCVLPLLDDGCALMERQYRYPVGQVLTEVPAGKLNDKSEDHLLAAQRELCEETGAVADKWTSLGIFYPACAYSDEAIEMYLAENIHFTKRHLDSDEFLNVTRIPLDELAQDVMDGKIPDAKTQIAVLKAYLLKNAQTGAAVPMTSV